MATKLLFCSEDLPRVLGQLHEHERRLLRPPEIVRVCRKAIELSESLGILKAVPITLEEMGISQRSAKEQKAYHSLLTQLLLMWWRENKKQIPRAQKGHQPKKSSFEKDLFA